MADMGTTPMKLIVQLTAWAVFLFLGGAPASAQVTPGFSNPKILIYEKENGDRGYWKTGTAADSKPLSAERMALRERMMKRRVLEEYAEFLSPLRLPYTLRLIASDCDGSAWDSPYYDSG